MRTTSSEVIFFVTRAGTVLHASPSIANVFGYFPEEIVGRNGFDLIHPEDHNHLRRAAGAVLSRPCTRRLHIRARRKDGEWLRLENTIYKLPDEYRFAQILVNCREIQSKNEGEYRAGKTDELPSSNAQLEQFASAVAHDLTEPLRSISLLAELLIKESKLDAHGDLLAQFIADGARRMSELFDGLRSFSTLGLDRSSQPVDLARVVAEVLQDLRHAITANDATVTTDSLPLVQGNKVHLARILQNLVANAIKYRSGMPVRIHISAAQLGLKWIVRIEDNGIGIRPEYHERVFQLFKRLHGREIPGSGLGLAACRKIVESTGDTIWVESEPGSGSTFCFTIAAIADKARSEGSFHVDTATAAAEYLH